MKRTALALLLIAAPALMALDPLKSLNQYSRTVWTQEHGLPQDTIRVIAQTTDGYLWLGTDEGLARFDGYEFTVFSKDRGELPSNSIAALAPGLDGSLWIGTSNGLTHYERKRFTTFTRKQGLPDDGITALLRDRSGALWIVAGIYLCRFERGAFTTYEPIRDIPITAVRTLCLDRTGTLWVAGFGGAARLDGKRFVGVVNGQDTGNDVITAVLKDHAGNLWLGGSKGLLMLSPGGSMRKYTAADGLPDPFVRSLWQDRDGNLWAGTNGGLSRLHAGRFESPPLDARGGRDWVRCLFEDREGNFWVGMNSGLNRLRDDVFTIYSKPEGLPSEEPTTVYQDRRGSVWIGFHDSGLVRFDPGHPARVFTVDDGLASNEVFSIREDNRGALLISTRDGFSRMEGARFTHYVPPDILGRRLVFDSLEDGQGRLWLATTSGLIRVEGGKAQAVIPGGTLLTDAVVVICQARDNTIWAGTYGKGLWRLDSGGPKLLTTADGLPSNQIRSLHADADGTLWIGTFGGGLARNRGGRFVTYASRNGLLSDNISHIEDDEAGSLWLATTRGISKIARRQLDDFTAGRIASLEPRNYGIEDGLRSAQCAPGYPTGGGGCRTRDGRLWFPTSRGLAVLDPRAHRPDALAPLLHVSDMTVDGHPVDVFSSAKLKPGSSRVQIRYTGIHLGAPERVVYSYKLEGLDRDWVRAGARRLINYNSLRHGSYRFRVRAELPGGPSSETEYSFELLPQFWETIWFRCLAAAALILAGWSVYVLRLRQIRGRFALVLEERAKWAREIHDTLAQGFVGISAQLDALAMCMPSGSAPAQRILDLARKMARYSLTEARRSVMDLRASALEGQDLTAALEANAKLWVAGSPLEVHLDVSGHPGRLPEETEQHLLRIVQEAVTNVMKHARAKEVWIRLRSGDGGLSLHITDDGQGFDGAGVFSSLGGHFGLIGMRERAERIGGELRLQSEIGGGTEVEVLVPLP